MYVGGEELSKTSTGNNNNNKDHEEEEEEDKEDWKATQNFFRLLIHGLTAQCVASHTESGKVLPSKISPYNCVFLVVGPTEEENIRAKRIMQEYGKFPSLVNEFVKGVKEGRRENDDKK